MYQPRRLVFNYSFKIKNTDINKRYVELCRENGAREASQKQGKYLKNLVQTNLPQISFTKRLDRRKSEVLQHQSKLGETIDLSMTYDFDGLGETMKMCSVAEKIRKELLEYKSKWSFNGDLTSGYQKPPLTYFFLKMLLFGKHATNSKRAAEISSVVDCLGQLLLYNVATDRQVRHKPKTEDATFRHPVDVPLPIALPLSIHQLVRSESLVTLTSKLHLGVNIDHIRGIYERTHTAVVERMGKTGGFCFPEFVVKGKPIWFAIDNIDFTEDTAFGQDSTHGTVIVVWQEEDTEAEKINPPATQHNTTPLEVPTTAKDVNADVEYLALSDIVPKAIMFDEVDINDQDASDNYLRKYVENINQTWAFACHMLRDTKQSTLDSKTDDATGESGVIEESEVEEGVEGVEDSTTDDATCQMLVIEQPGVEEGVEESTPKDYI